MFVFGVNVKLLVFLSVICVSFAYVCDTYNYYSNKITNVDFMIVTNRVYN